MSLQTTDNRSSIDKARDLQNQIVTAYIDAYMTSETPKEFPFRIGVAKNRYIFRERPNGKTIGEAYKLDNYRYRAEWIGSVKYLESMDVAVYEESVRSSARGTEPNQ